MSHRVSGGGGGRRVDEEVRHRFTLAIFTFSCRVLSLFTSIDVFCGRLAKCNPFSHATVCRSEEFGGVL